MRTAPPLTPAHRGYLRAFDAHLKAPNTTSAFATRALMTIALERICDQADVNLRANRRPLFRVV